MTSLQHVTDHEARGMALLSEQFKHKSAITALLKSWCAEVQALEDEVYELQAQRTLASASGVGLDVIGALVGQPREGRTDAQYKLWIAGRILVNKSRGKAPQLIAIARKLCNGPVRFKDYYPAGFMIFSEAPIAGSDGVEIAKLLKIAKAAGVSMQFHWFDSPTAFRFSTTGASVFNSERGFTTGRFATVSDGRHMEFGAPAPEPEPSAGFPGALLVVL
jgi:hypothetical protein